jgi:peptidoglycan/LPS O-acetylase OafA/YrhL
VVEVQQTQRKLLYFESLRGVAAVVVIFSHFANAFFPAASIHPGLASRSAIDPLLHNTPLGIVLAGNFAVCLFFVMSAYVLVRPYFLSKRQDVLTSAAVRRYVRLMPPAAISILIGYIVLSLGLFTAHGQAAVTRSPWLSAQWHFAPNLGDAVYQAFFGAFFNQTVTYNPLLWTMTTEFLGSLLIFAVAALFGGLTRRWIIYVVLAVLLARTYYLGFIVGMAMADYFSSPRSWVRTTFARTRGRYFAILLLVGLVLGAYPSDDFVGQTLYRGLMVPGFSTVQLMTFWHTLGAILAVTSILCWTSAKTFLSNRWLVQLGKMSFSIYLTHLIVLCSVGTALFAGIHANLSYHVSALITFLVLMPFILAVGYLYTEYIDGPSIKAAKWAGNWLMSKTPARPREAAPYVGAPATQTAPVKTPAV